MSCYNFLNYYFSKMNGNISEQAISETILKNSKLANKYHVLLITDLQKYELDKSYCKKSLYYALIGRICLFIISIRFLLTSIFHDEVSPYMADVCKEIGERTLMSIYCCLGVFTNFCILSVTFYQELNRKFNLHSFLNAMISGRLFKYMNYSVQNKYKTIVNILSNILMRPFYWTVMIVLFIPYIFLSILVYFDKDITKSNSDVKYIVLWLVPTYFVVQQLAGLLSIGMVYWMSATLYLKYAFNKIHDDIYLGIKYGNRNLILQSIINHRIIEGQNNELNQVFKFMIFFLYYMASPLLMLCVHLVQSSKIHPFKRIIGLFFFVMSFSTIFGLNYSSSQIRRAAH